jgi:hypothetical protein
MNPLLSPVAGSIFCCSLLLYAALSCSIQFRSLFGLWTISGRYSVTKTRSLKRAIIALQYRIPNQIGELRPLSNAEKPAAQPRKRHHQDHLIDRLLPEREVHLLAGPSGAGKTTWLTAFLHSWSHGEAIFGNKSHPAPYLYISLDRSYSSVLRTLDRLGMAHDQFPFYEPPDSITSATPLIKIIEDAKKKHPDVRLVVVEGIASRVPDGKSNDYKIVADFLLSLRKTCEKLDITVLGVAHTTKTKGEDRYENPRQRIAGSVAWGGFSETIIILEPKDPEDVSENAPRELMLLPRNWKEQVFEYGFVDGLLVEKKTVKTTNYQTMQLYLSNVSENPNTGTRLFNPTEAMEKTGLSKSSLYAELTKLLNQRVIEKLDHGSYRIIKNAGN